MNHLVKTAARFSLRDREIIAGISPRYREEIRRWEPEEAEICDLPTNIDLPHYSKGVMALWAAAECGVDIQYVLTGVRSPNCDDASNHLIGLDGNDKL